ncbi:MAG: hypothetical protein CMC96_06565 [Flavobacteriales bacterium]|nr:hypothetical protein [Flavobacteriales bacterium]|tara:strand:+ start:5453 stop:7270 length:1818 start_codon:yes stop_codon:yes gene_type:complete
MKVNLLFLFLTFFAISPAFAQEAEEDNDSLVIKTAKNTYRLNFQSADLNQVDGFQQYRIWGAHHMPFARSGNLGLAAHRLSVEAQDWSVNHNLGAYQTYVLNEDSMKFYQVSQPVTQLIYVNGAEEEQRFVAFHTQNLGEGLNISFQYDRMTSTGFFLRQLTNHTRFYVNYNLHSRNKRFHSKGYYAISNLKSQENGGVFLSDEESEEDNTVLLDINLFDAQNRSRSQVLGLNNQYDLIRIDSNNTLFNIYHKFNYVRSYRNYNHDLTNSNQDFYRKSFFDPTLAADSAFVDELSNEVGVQLFNHRLLGGLRQSSFNYFQNYLIDQNLNSSFFLAQYNDTLLGQHIYGYFEKGLSGFHRDEFELQAKVNFQQVKTFKFSAEASITQKQPDYFLEQYRSNQNYFNQSLKTANAQVLRFRMQEEFSGIDLSVSVKNLSNFVYFDSLSQVQQSESAISLVEIQLKKHFVFFRNMNLLNKIVFQQFSDKEITPLPELYSYHSLYYGNELFNKKLNLQFGFDLYYLGEYEGYAFSPSLAQMHLRGKGTEVLGNITQLDFFLSMGINQNARAFVKFENLLYDNFDAQTYRIQDYPIPGRALKFGLSWTMLN